MPLTEIAVKNAKAREKRYKMTDGLGLFLLVHPNGGRYWRLKYRFDGKEKLLSLGTYPETSIKEARERRDVARSILTEGRDPGAVKQEQRRVAQLASDTTTFGYVAREFLEKQPWTRNYAKSVLRRLELDIFPDLAGRPIVEITPPELLAAIRKIEARGATELCHRTLQKCGQIFRYGIATGQCSRDIAADLRGALTPHVKQHMAAVAPDELPRLLTSIASYGRERRSAYDKSQIITRLGLKMLALTFIRTNELIGAEWHEFDFEKNVWVVPEQRMKMKLEHMVPLSRQVMELLDAIKSINGTERFVFASPTGWKKHISNNTLLFALYRLGYQGRMTGHGFRAVASTILNETREQGEHSFSADVIERQLAHTEKNQVRAAYNRAKYLRERTAMMQWWADFLDRQAGGRLFSPTS